MVFTALLIHHWRNMWARKGRDWTQFHFNGFGIVHVIYQALATCTIVIHLSFFLFFFLFFFVVSICFNFVAGLCIIQQLVANVSRLVKLLLSFYTTFILICGKFDLNISLFLQLSCMYWYLCLAYSLVTGPLSFWLAGRAEGEFFFFLLLPFA